MVEVLTTLIHEVKTPLAIVLFILYGIRFDFKIERVNGKNKVSLTVSFRSIRR